MLKHKYHMNICDFNTRGIPVLSGVIEFLKWSIVCPEH